MFATKREGVAAALRAGVALEAVADAEGVSATTIRGWLRRGKREPASEFGGFLRDSEPAVEAEAPMSVGEVERVLTELIRQKKSLGACVAWLRLHTQDQVSADDDPLAAFLPGGSDGLG
jgi:transposase-like protein